jgi:hypothetical protein
LEGSGLCHIEVLSRQFLGRNKEKPRKPYSGQPVFLPRMEPLKKDRNSRWRWFFLFTGMQTARTINIYDVFAPCIYSQLEADVGIIHATFIKNNFRFTCWGNPRLTSYLFSFILNRSCVMFRGPLVTSL